MPGCWRNCGAVLAVATALAACGSSAHSRGSPPDVTLADCDRPPASTGPLVPLARLTVEAPAAAVGGQRLRVTTSVMPSADGPRVITKPATSALLVLRDGQVVGRALGAAAAPRVPLYLSSGAVRPAQAVPDAIELVSCADNLGEPAALPPGSYALVAVLGYEPDSFNGAAPDAPRTPPNAGRNFALVSAPQPLIID